MDLAANYSVYNSANHCVILTANERRTAMTHSLKTSTCVWLWVISQSRSFGGIFAAVWWSRDYLKPIGISLALDHHLPSSSSSSCRRSEVFDCRQPSWRRDEPRSWNRLISVCVKASRPPNLRGRRLPERGLPGVWDQDLDCLPMGLTCLCTMWWQLVV